VGGYITKLFLAIELSDCKNISEKVVIQGDRKEGGKNVLGTWYKNFSAAPKSGGKQPKSKEGTV